jgi:tripartite-type tricarboxylate transporter receptor subunit TctC
VTSLKPSPLVPGLPALAQSGLAGFEVIGWNGFVAPKDTPQPIVAKLSAAIDKALADPDVRAKMNTAGYELAAVNSPDDFARFITVDTEKWIGLATKTGIKAN